VGKKCVLAKDKSGRNNENKEGKMKEKNDKWKVYQFGRFFCVVEENNFSRFLFFYRKHAFKFHFHAASYWNRQRYWSIWIKTRSSWNSRELKNKISSPKKHFSHSKFNLKI
jgi:hypothetical protein